MSNLKSYFPAAPQCVTSELVRSTSLGGRQPRSLSSLLALALPQPKAYKKHDDDQSATAQAACQSWTSAFRQPRSVLQLDFAVQQAQVQANRARTALFFHHLYRSPRRIRSMQTIKVPRHQRRVNSEVLLFTSPALCYIWTFPLHQPRWHPTEHRQLSTSLGGSHLRSHSSLCPPSWTQPKAYKKHEDDQSATAPAACQIRTFTINPPKWQPTGHAQLFF